MSPIKLDISTLKHPIKIVRHLFLNIYIYIMSNLRFYIYINSLNESKT